MAEQIKFGDRLFLAGEKVILDNGTGPDDYPKLEARNGKLVIGYNTGDPQAADHHVIIKGDLTVEGTTTTVNTETITLADPFILLNGDITNTTVPSEDVGIEINRGSELNKKFGWDETNDQWVTYNETLNLGTGDLIATDINAVNLTLTGALTAASNLQHQIGDFTFNQNVMSVVSEQMEIRSPGGISFYPDEDNSLPVPQGGEKIVWLRDGAKLVFEGTVPDDFEVKLQATDITEDRDIILPDESGTLALQEWTEREIEQELNALTRIVWEDTSNSAGNFRTSSTYVEDGISYIIRQVSIVNNKLQLELASFTPVLTVIEDDATLSWDQAATGFSVSVQNPDDFPDRYVNEVGAITNSVGIHTNIADYTASAQSQVPAGTVDWTQSFDVTPIATIYSNGTGLVGGLASADVEFNDETGTSVGSAALQFNWSDANVTINFSNLSGKTFLEQYTSVNYTVSDTLQNSSNRVHTVSSASGTLTNTTGSGILTFTTSLHKDNNSGRSVDVSTEFTRPAEVTGTSYTVTDTASDATISASFSYPSFYVWTSDSSTAPGQSDIVSGSSYSSGVVSLGHQDKTISTTITNNEAVPQTMWFGVRASASQPTSFQTGPSEALLVDVSITNSFIILQPNPLPTDYVGEPYNLYGITLQPGDTYVRIS